MVVQAGHARAGGGVEFVMTSWRFEAIRGGRYPLLEVHKKPRLRFLVHKLVGGEPPNALMSGGETSSYEACGEKIH